MLKKIAAFVGALALWPGWALSDALNVGSITIDVRLNENDLIPEGIVWQSSRLFTGTTEFGSFLPKDNVSLVLTTSPEVGWGFWPNPEPRIDQVAAALPIKLEGTELYLTFVGEVVGLWGNSSIAWKSSNYLSSTTKSYTTVLVPHPVLEGMKLTEEAKSGTLSYELWPVIYCPKKEGCKVPQSDVKVIDYYIRLYTSGLFDSGLAIPIIYGGTLKFEAGCEFKISPTAFNDIQLFARGQGVILDTFTSNYSATCSRAGSLHVLLTPTDTILESDNRIGKTNLEGIGIVHNFASENITSLNQAKPWFIDTDLGILQNSGSLRKLEGKIQWGFYQYEANPQMGELNTSVNYEFWVE